MEVIHDGVGSASTHMERDRLLITKGGDHPLLRLYDWNDFCITTGVFLDPASLVDLDRCQQAKVEVAKRPTGGGLLFHGADCALSLFIPGHQMAGNGEEWCARINERLLQAVSRFLPSHDQEGSERSTLRCRFCMSQITAYDLVWRGMKIGGCAERKTRFGVLHQASLFVTPPNWEKIAVFLKDPGELYRMQQTSQSLSLLAQREIGKGEIATAIHESFLEWSIE